MTRNRKPIIEPAMTPQQVADVLGCQPEQAHELVTKYWVLPNGRKRFRESEVYRVRNRMERQATEMRLRNRRMERRAAK